MSMFVDCAWNNQRCVIMTAEVFRMLDYEKIGRKIKNERKIRGLTQEKLAEKIDVCVPYVGLIERGKRIPSLEKW